MICCSWPLKEFSRLIDCNMSFCKKILASGALAAIVFGGVFAVIPAQASEQIQGPVMLAQEEEEPDPTTEERAQERAEKARRDLRAEYLEEVQQKISQKANAGVFENVSLACYEDGFCTLCDFLIIFVTIANWILRTFAVLAVVFFVYGAGYLVISSGNEAMVTKGKGIIKATIIGSIIVLVAWQLMNYIVTVVINQSIFTETEQEAVTPFSWHDATQRCNEALSRQSQ